MSYISTQKKLINISKEDIFHRPAYGEPYDLYYHDLYNDLFYKNCVFKNNLSNGFYVEIGALDGVVNSQSFIFEKELKWDGIVVEPNPLWHENLEIYRKCKISKEAISDKNGEELFECREMAAFSGLISSKDVHRISNINEEIKVKTITLLDLLDKNNAPDEINWISVDVEGGEYDILNHYFENNFKYKINLINVETNYFDKISLLFSNQNYSLIKNPYLDFLRMSYKHGLVKFEPITGHIYKAPYLESIVPDFDDLIPIYFENYFIHNEFLEKNAHLKTLLIK